MEQNQETIYHKKIVERFAEILNITGLEIKGIAALTNKSIDIFYAILAGRRKLSTKLAILIGQKLDFEGLIIFKIDEEIPLSISKSPTLLKFKKEFKLNEEYFKDTKDSTFIYSNLITRNFFATPKYAWEVAEELSKLGRKIKSDHLSKHLKYFVKTGILAANRQQIKRRDGSYGERMVETYKDPRREL